MAKVEVRKSPEKKVVELKPLSFKPSYKSILAEDRVYSARYIKGIRLQHDFHVACMTTKSLVKAAKKLARLIKVGRPNDEEKVIAQRNLRLQYMMNELEYREAPMSIIRGLSSYITDPVQGEKILSASKIQWIFNKQVEEVRFHVA